MPHARSCRNARFRWRAREGRQLCRSPGHRRRCAYPSSIRRQRIPPAVERRPASGAEPAGRREAMPAPDADSRFPEIGADAPQRRRPAASPRIVQPSQLGDTQGVAARAMMAATTSAWTVYYASTVSPASRSIVAAACRAGPPGEDTVGMVSGRPTASYLERARAW